MPRSLADLSSLHLCLLAALDDGFPFEDSVGLMIEDEHLPWLEAAEDLRRLDLVELSFGWRGRFWLRLSEKGRSLRVVGRPG